MFNIGGLFVEQIISSLVDAQTNRVLADPSTEKTFLGLSYKRLASYIRTSSLDDLNRYSGKVLLVHGREDSNSAVEGSYHLHRQLADRDPTMVEINILDGMDHSLKNQSGADEMAKVLEGVVNWSVGSHD